MGAPDSARRGVRHSYPGVQVRRVVPRRDPEDGPGPEHQFERGVGYDAEGHEVRTGNPSRPPTRCDAGPCRGTTGRGGGRGCGRRCGVAGRDLPPPRVEGRLGESVLAAEVPNGQSRCDPLRNGLTPEPFELRVVQMWSRHDGYSEGNASSYPTTQDLDLTGRLPLPEVRRRGRQDPLACAVAGHPARRRALGGRRREAGRVLPRRGRAILKRYNDRGPDAVADGRRENGADPNLMPGQQREWL